MTTQRIPTLATMLLLPLAVPAGLGASTPALPVGAAEATMRVTNDNHQAVDVLLVGGAGQYDLGMVASKATSVLSIPDDLVGMHNVRVLANPVDDLTGFQSKPITVQPGREVDLVVASRATRSHLSVK
jgi:hypothetical protein